MTRPDLHIVPPVWNRAEAYRPEQRPSWFALLKADASDIVAEIRAHPESHAIVAFVSFIVACAFVYGSAWVLVHTVLA